MTNIKLISAPKSFPNSENAPITITVSWTSAIIAQTAYLEGFGTEEKAKRTYAIINRVATAIARVAFRTAALDTTGETVENSSVTNGPNCSRR